MLLGGLLGGWKGAIVAVGRAIEERFDALWHKVRRRYGWALPAEVRPYRGHGTEGVLYMKGRVLELRGVTPSSATDTARANFRNMVRRFLSAEVRYASVRAVHDGHEIETVADEEGFFDVCLELPEASGATEPAWRPVEVEVLWPEEDAGARATGFVLVPRGASFGVISDLDDTVIRSSVTSLLEMLRTTLFHNAHTRLPFEGVASFYRALQEDGETRNPIFYVSSSPWNLYDLLEEFLNVHGVPVGPIFLKDWGLTTLGRHEEHKLGIVRTLFATYPEMPFVLVGDSGQKDPEIYRQVVREHPGRVSAIYIRDVSTAERDEVVHDIARDVGSLGVEMLLVADTATAAEHAANRGLISADALPSIRRVSD